MTRLKCVSNRASRSDYSYTASGDPANGRLISQNISNPEIRLLQVWSDATAVATRTHSPPDTPFYMGIYFCFGLGTLVIMVIRSTAIVYGSVKASRKLHADLLEKVRMICLPTTCTRHFVGSLEHIKWLRAAKGGCCSRTPSKPNNSSKIRLSAWTFFP